MATFTKPFAQLLDLKMNMAINIINKYLVGNKSIYINVALKNIEAINNIKLIIL